MISQFMILANSWFFSGTNFMNSSQIHDFETKNSKQKFFSENFSGNSLDFFTDLYLISLWLKKKWYNYRRRLEISAAEFKIHIRGKYLDKHVKIFFTIIFWVSKIKISWKLAKKGDFGNILDPFQGFTLKTVLRIHDPCISW